jgi:hypothetical protein
MKKVTAQSFNLTDRMILQMKILKGASSAKQQIKPSKEGGTIPPSVLMCGMLS